jgi:L-ascorbate metabolism protein UlaG (beta-lactamase superfamily)
MSARPRATAAPAGDDAAGLRLTYVGHATVLVELDGVRLLTDPVLRPRILHLRRRTPASLEPAPLDAVLLSHAHRDHLDVLTLRRLPADTRLIAPDAAVRALRRRGFLRPIEPIAAGGSTSAGRVSIRATEAEHGRAGTAVGYLISGSRTVYFAGDTGLFAGMDGLADRLDVALLPIWGWGPRLGPGHLDPESAAEAVRRLRPRVVVPIHWGTLHPVGLAGARFLDEPPRRFAALVRERAPEVEVYTLAPGGSVAIAGAR